MLTPIDIQNRNLKTTMGGYNKKDTDDFLASILESYEELYKENKDLKEKITSLSEGIQYYKQMESTLQKALVLAEKTSTETQEAAKSQAESILKEAQVKADAILGEAQNKADVLLGEAAGKANSIKGQAEQELSETRNHVRKLVQGYENYRLQFKKLASSQIEMLESDVFSIHEPEIDKFVKEDMKNSAIEKEATTEVSEEKNETVDDAIVNPVMETEELKQEGSEAPKEKKIIDENDLPVEKIPVPEAFANADLSLNNKAADTEEKKEEVKESPFINPIDMLEPSTPFVDIPDQPTVKKESPFIDIPNDPFTTPVVDDVKKADVSDTVYPKTTQDDNSMPYFDYVMPNVTEKKESKKEDAAASAESSPFIFIDPE